MAAGTSGQRWACGWALPLLLAGMARLCADLAPAAPGLAPATLRPAPLAWLLVLGPIQETMLLMCAATLMLRHRPGPRLPPATRTALIAASFVLAHGLLYGPAALVSLPMAWVLSDAATRAAARPDAAAQLSGAARLTAMHAVYNAGLCWLP